VRGLRVGAGERCEHALIFGPLARRRVHQPVEIACKAAGAVEVLDEPPLPGGRKVERRDQRGEQRDIAHADFRRIDTVVRSGFEPERQHFGIGGSRVAPPERLDAGLNELGRPLGAMTEHRRQIAEAERFAGFRRGEIIARHRNGEVGPQAKLAPVRIGGEEHAAADVLAGEIEERFGRLQDRGRDARVARALVMRDERLRPCVGRGHGCSALEVSRMARAFSTLTLRFRLRSPGGLNAEQTAR